MTYDNMKQDTAEKKARIRARYAAADDVTVIPAKPQPSLDDTRQMRVAVYARVSTGDPRQTTSYELQKNYYQDFVARHPNWTLSDIYADEGISGTSLQHRDAFLRMIKDCREHKIDLIVTKSVSRFARNTLDCLGCVQELKALEPPVGILFEVDNIFSLDPDAEVRLSIMATFAQEESHIKSDSMNASIDMRFRRGNFLTPPLLGYDQDKDGDLIINEDEARTVQLIFYMYLYGYSCTQIADALTQLSRPTKKGNVSWSAGSVLNVLQNERHCGDVLARKTWTPNYLDHKSKKNRRDRAQYHKSCHHAAIISRDDFIAVQRLIRNAKYGNKGFLPDLRVISQGPLTGFVLIHPRWANFKAQDYLMASASVNDPNCEENQGEIEIHAQAGDFDYRGYEVARSQFFDTSHKSCITFSACEIQFSTECVRKLPGVQFVELLLHPYKRILAARPSTKDNRRALQWAKVREGSNQGRGVSGRAFLPSLFALLGWNTAYRYRVRGVKYAAGQEQILLFDLTETEIYIPKKQLPASDTASLPLVPDRGSSAAAYPANWTQSFGAGFYCLQHSKRLTALGLQDNFDIPPDETAFSCPSMPRATPENAVRSRIEELINQMKMELKEDE